MNKNDYTNMALHFYHASAVTTSGGALNISTSYSPTSFQSAEDDKGFVVMTKRRKPYSSGMVQGWGKFCFTGGIMEVRAKLPGAGSVGARRHLARHRPSLSGLPWPVSSRGLFARSSRGACSGHLRVDWCRPSSPSSCPSMLKGGPGQEP